MLCEIPMPHMSWVLEEKSHDDKLQYRLGQMLHTGTGTEKDNTAAAEYWEKSAKLGNIQAQYALGKLWLEHGNGDPAKAVRWITKAAETGNEVAQYALGKIYRDGEYPRPAEKSAWPVTTASRYAGTAGTTMPQRKAAVPLILCRCFITRVFLMQSLCFWTGNRGRCTGRAVQRSRNRKSRLYCRRQIPICGGCSRILPEPDVWTAAW